MKLFRFPIDERNYVQIEDGYDYGYRKIIAIYPYFPKSVKDLATPDQLKLIKQYLMNPGDKSNLSIDSRFGHIQEIIKNERMEVHKRIFGKCPTNRKFDPTFDEILEMTLTKYQADRIIKTVNNHDATPALLFYTDKRGNFEYKWF